MSEKVEFEVIVDEEVVASTCGERSFAFKEALHYANQYVEDGTVEVYEVTRKLVHLIDTPLGWEEN
jgi:hypothetical protein